MGIQATTRVVCSHAYTKLHRASRAQYTEAARAAYPNVKASAVWASRLLQNRRIKKVIALHLGMSETEAVLADVKALIKKSKRKNAHLDLLLAPWLRVAAALEAIDAKSNTGN